jgi:hypothetical protein
VARRSSSPKAEIALPALNCSAFDNQQGVKADRLVKRLMLAFDTIEVERRRRVATCDGLATLPQGLVKHERGVTGSTNSLKPSAAEIRFGRFHCVEKYGRRQTRPYDSQNRRRGLPSRGTKIRLILKPDGYDSSSRDAFVERLVLVRV